MTARYYDGSRKIPLTLEIDDDKWQRMKMTLQTGYPRFWHPIGQDLYELYPTPSTAQTGGILLSCIIRQKPMSAADYTTGTASISLNGYGRNRHWYDFRARYGWPEVPFSRRRW